MYQHISSASQKYTHGRNLEELEDEREAAVQRRQAAQYRREREVQQVQVSEYSAKYW